MSWNQMASIWLWLITNKTRFEFDFSIGNCHRLELRRGNYAEIECKYGTIMVEISTIFEQTDESNYSVFMAQLFVFAIYFHIQRHNDNFVWKAVFYFNQSLKNIYDARFYNQQLSGLLLTVSMLTEHCSVRLSWFIFYHTMMLYSVHIFFSKTWKFSRNAVDFIFCFHRFFFHQFSLFN